jgi:hypothetical protein
MTIEALDACLDMNSMAVSNGLIGGRVYLEAGENHPSDYENEN